MRTFQTNDGLTLAYTDTGEGIPVLCLPGLTRNGRDFDDMARALGMGQRLICLDSRGRGGSDHDPNFHNYAIPVEAADAIALLDHLKLERVVVVGTSRGGLIAMVLAATHKQRLSGVVLNDIGPVIDTAGLDRIKDYLGKNPPFRTHEDAAAQLAEQLRGQFDNVSPQQWLAAAKRWWDAGPDGLVINYDPRLADAVAAAGAQPAPDLWPLFDALSDIPLATIRGANSDLLSAETLNEMARRNPDMTAVTILDRAHVPFLDEPDAVAAIRSVIAAA